MPLLQLNDSGSDQKISSNDDADDDKIGDKDKVDDAATSKLKNPEENTKSGSKGKKRRRKKKGRHDPFNSVSMILVSGLVVRHCYS